MATKTQKPLKLVLFKDIDKENRTEVVDKTLNDSSKDPSNGANKTERHIYYLQQKRKSYIPINPYGLDEDSDRHRIKGVCGLYFYQFPEIPKDAIYQLADGSEILAYRWRLRKWLFKKFDEGVALDAAGFNDVTPEDVAVHIADTITSFDKGNPETNEEKSNSDVILEVCCGCGGNTIALAQKFNKVIAIEMSDSRLKMAKQNAEIYHVSEKIEWIHDDIIKWYEKNTLKMFQWAFLSPPWGGDGYKRKGTYYMRESTHVNFYDIILKLSKIAINIAVFLPVTQDVEEIAKLSQEIFSCSCVIIDDIFVGVGREIKYQVVYFLSEDVAKNSIKNFQATVSELVQKELEENSKFVSPSFPFLTERIGSHAMLELLSDTFNIYNSGGLNRIEVPDEKRTLGGIFFQLIKERRINLYRDLNKFRKSLNKNSEKAKTEKIVRSMFKSTRRPKI